MKRPPLMKHGLTQLEVQLTMDLLEGPKKSRDALRQIANYFDARGRVTKNLRPLIVERLRALAPLVDRALPAKSRKNARPHPNQIEAEIAEQRALLSKHDNATVRRARRLGHGRLDERRAIQRAAVALVANARGRTPGTITRMRFHQSRPAEKQKKK